MAQEKKADQTEKPTPKKLKDARKEGDIHQSQDLTKTFLLLVWLGLIALLMDYIAEHLFSVFQLAFINVPQVDRHQPLELVNLSLEAASHLFYALLPMLVVSAVMGTFISFMQAGVVFAPKKVLPKIEHINPVSGLKKIFSQRNLVEFVKSVVKTLILAAIIIAIVYSLLADILILPQGSISAVFATYWQAVLYVLGFSIFVFFFVAILDAFYQRYD